MKTADEEDLAAPFFSSDEKLVELERRLYAHVLEAIDFDAVSSLEQHVCMLLADEHDVPQQLAYDLAAKVIEQALQRAALDPIRYCDVGPPPGITEAERRAVAFEADCPFCQFDAQQARAAAEGKLQNDEPCACCDMMAEDWRQEHADVLAKAGLAESSTEAEPS